MLEGVLKNYRTEAERIKWRKEDTDCNEIWYNYIKHEHDELGNAYFAGLVCRYWGYIAIIYNSCNKHVTFEQCYDVFIDAIKYTLDKRVWENPDNKLYQVYGAPNIAFTTKNWMRERGKLLKSLNTQKRVSNFNTMSLDSAHEEYNDSTDGMFFDVTSSEFDDIIMDSMISDFCKEQPIKGLILDVICNRDKLEFSEQKTINSIKKLDKSYFNNFKSKYNLTDEQINSLRLEINNLTKSQLGNKIRAVLYEVKTGVYGENERRD